MLRKLSYLIVCLSCLVTPFLGTAQEMDEKVKASTQIKDLKEGVLLVKLYTDQRKIDGLRKHGREASAQKAEQERDSINQAIVLAMSEHYKFSEVAYFYSSAQEEVIKGDYSNVFKEDLKTISDINHKREEVFILDSRYVFFESMQTDQLGLSVHDSELKALDRPFPYYVRKRAALFFLRRDEAKMVEMLQENLQKFYDKSRGA